MKAPARVGLLGAGAASLGILFSALPFGLEVEESLGLGWLFAFRGTLEPPSEVAVVGLATDSADALGVSTDVDEWPRELHARLIDRLTRAGASVIAFDIIFESDRPDVQGDMRLAEAIEQAGNVLLLERVRSEEHPTAVIERRILPIEPFRRNALATAPFILPTVPIRVNQFWTFGRASGDVASLPSAVLHAHALSVHDRFIDLIARARPESVPLLEDLRSDRIAERGLQEIMRRVRNLFAGDGQLGAALSARLPEGAGSESKQLLGALIELYSGEASRYLNFYGPSRTIRTIPYHSALETPMEHLREAVGGRAVFIGFSERRQSEQQDEFFSVFSERTGQSLSGVEIGATAFANLVRGESVVPVSLPAHWAVLSVWALLAAAVSVLLRGFFALAAALGGAGAYALVFHYAFQAHGLWLPLAVPLGLQLPFALLTGLAWNYAVLRRQREQIHAALGYYLPADVVDRLAQETTRLQSSREIVHGTCLVTDAEQYTTLSEALHPAELGELMDAYYDVLVEAVHKHGGVVSDIGGDSMVAVWPAAQSPEQTRLAASRGALEVLAAVDAFNRSRTLRELPTRIGVDSGQLLLGNVGASGRGEYRAVGDIVNTASRLQGLNRLLGTKVLLSAAAMEKDAELDHRPLGEFLLLGKRTPVSVVELQWAAAGERAELLELNRAFAEALGLFRNGDWTGAEAAFAAVAERFPDDAAARFFMAQCRQLASREPGEPWDGVVRVAVK